MYRFKYNIIFDLKSLSMIKELLLSTESSNLFRDLPGLE